MSGVTLQNLPSPERLWVRLPGAEASRFPLGRVPRAGARDFTAPCSDFQATLQFATSCSLLPIASLLLFSFFPNSSVGVHDKLRHKGCDLIKLGISIAMD